MIVLPVNAFCCLGDVVISTRPIAADENVIKRITAIAGQTVVFFKPGETAPVPVKVGARSNQQGEEREHSIGSLLACHGPV